MSTDRPQASVPPPAEFEIPDVFLDERAVRRAVLRGVLRTGLAALGWLLTGLLILGIAGTAAAAHRAERLSVLIPIGAQVAHPEYEFGGNSCCGGWGGPGLTYTFTQTVRLRGAQVSQDETQVAFKKGLWGTDYPELDPRGQSPIRTALARGRIDKAASRQFLATLPTPTVASAIVEFTAPVDRAAFEAFALKPSVPYAIGAAVFVTDPYPADQGQVLSWPNPDLAAFTRWAGQLRSSDDADLRRLDLPTAASIKRVASDPRIHAFVVDRAPLDELRRLLDDPQVRNVNIADVAFDPGRQSRGPGA